MIASNLRKMYTSCAMRLLTGLLALLPGLALAACDSTTSPTSTTRAGIQKPAINSCSWGSTLNRDFDIIDSSFAVLAASNTFTSTNTFSKPIIIESRQPLRFYDDSTHYLDFRASQTVATTGFVWPAADGSSGQVLKTDGAGNLSFITASGGSASTLGVSVSSVSVTTPTASINFIGPPFSVTAVNTSTAQVTLDFSSVTAQGNTFNQASKLVKLDSSARLPAVDASQLTNISFSTTAMTVSTLSVTSSGTFAYGLTTGSVTVRSTATLAYVTMSTFTASSGTVSGTLSAGVLRCTSFPGSPNLVAYFLPTGELNTSISGEMDTTPGFGPATGDMATFFTETNTGYGIFASIDNGFFGGSTIAAGYFNAVNGAVNYALYADGGKIHVGDLNASQFVKTDGSSDLTVVSLFADTNTWTGGNTFQSSATLNGTIRISSGVLLSGAAGSSGQFLTSGGAGTVPTWTTSASASLTSTQTWTGNNTFRSSTTLRGVTTSSYTVTAGTITDGPYAMTVSTFGHIGFQDFASSPTLSACGTGPAMTGNDTVFQITGGTAANGCTATFAKPYIKAPICQVSQETMSLVNAMSYSVSNTAVTITQTGLGTNKLDVHCFGRD